MKLSTLLRDFQAIIDLIPPEHFYQDLPEEIDWEEYLSEKLELCGYLNRTHSIMAEKGGFETTIIREWEGISTRMDKSLLLPLLESVNSITLIRILKDGVLQIHDDAKNITYSIAPRVPDEEEDVV